MRCPVDPSPISHAIGSIELDDPLLNRGLGSPDQAPVTPNAPSEQRGADQPIAIGTRGAIPIWRTVMRVLLTILLLSGFGLAFQAEAATVNYDEAVMPSFTLPDPLVCFDGSPVVSAEDWIARRRPEVLDAFRREVYGRSPGAPQKVEYRLLEASSEVLDGTAIRKQVRLVVHGLAPDRSVALDLLLYIPKGGDNPAPAFVGLNFRGNHAVTFDPEVLLSQPWTGPRPNGERVEFRPQESERGSQASRWPIPMILEQGYAVGTVYCGDIDPDFHDGFANGVHPLFRQAGETERAEDAWGTIAGWAWGLSRVLDYLETDPDIDAGKVAVIGHSRLGKTALWAGAEDPRFAMVISNDSGCGGAALSRRRIGESVERINTAFPHWFCTNYRAFNDNEDASLVDQHLLLALIAPRPVYVASAEDDKWADPRGEFLALRAASPVYKLFGGDGLEGVEAATVNQPVAADAMFYHLRSGGHDITPFDWQQYLAAADRFLK